MRIRKLMLSLLGAAMLLPLGMDAVYSEGGGGQQGGARGGRGGGRPWMRGGFNREEFMKRMEERMKQMLKVTDEEWGALKPLIDNIRKLQLEASGRSFGRRGGFGQGGQEQELTGARKVAQELRQLLEKEDTTEAAIKAKLDELRTAKEKAAASLKAARDELREVLTPRQEAVLVLSGTLE